MAYHYQTKKGFIALSSVYTLYQSLTKGQNGEIKIKRFLEKFNFATTFKKHASICIELQNRTQDLIYD